MSLAANTPNVIEPVGAPPLNVAVATAAEPSGLESGAAIAIAGSTRTVSDALAVLPLPPFAD